MCVTVSVSLVDCLVFMVVFFHVFFRYKTAKIVYNAILRRYVAVKRIIIMIMCCLLIFSMQSMTFANVPEIVIDGEVVSEKEESKLVAMAKKVQEMYIADRAAGNNWTYQSKFESPSTFSESFAAGVRYTNCSDGVNKLIREAGLVPRGTGFFFGCADGSVAWLGNSKEVYEQYATIFHYADGTTVQDLLDSGRLMAGDVVTYLGYGHTNLYCGDGYWFDTGHANCTKKKGDGAPFWTFYKHGGPSSSRVGCVIRLKTQYDSVTPSEPIVIENISSGSGITIEDVTSEMVDMEIDSDVGMEEDYDEEETIVEVSVRENAEEEVSVGMYFD